LQEQKRATTLGLFLNQFKSPIILILLLATGISAILGDWVDAIIILITVGGNAVLSFSAELIKRWFFRRFGLKSKCENEPSI
jgi:Mg2+-importing ATPase